MADNDKLSIIIPTLQKNLTVLTKLIDELVNKNYIGEIIVIDNSLKGFSYSSEKVKVTIPENNLFVNPSWNYGIELAKYDYWGILNDDILLPQNLCDEIFNFLLNNQVGIVGINNKCIYGDDKNETYDYPANSDVKFEVFESDNKGLGYWGIALFGHKSSYYKIPEEMKIWYGDNFLFKMNNDNGKQNYKVYCREIKHIGSLTSSNPKLDGIKQADADFYATIDSRYIGTDVTLKAKKTIWKFIFSIRNSDNKRYKEVTILGFKIYIKKRI